MVNNRTILLSYHFILNELNNKNLNFICKKKKFNFHIKSAYIINISSQMTSVDQIRISLKPALVYETQKTQIFTTIPTSLTSSEDCLYYTLPHPHYYPCML